MSPSPSRPIRIGVQLQPQHASYAEIRDAVRRAEDLGVDIIFNWDHFYPLSGDPDGRHYEAMTVLAAWAEQTSRIELGPLVACNSYRNPDLLADMARTIDHVSDGRFVLGIGSGWARRDYDEYGYPFGTAGSRLDDLAVALPRIKQRWEALNPRPTRDIPVLIGGGGEKKTLRLVAEHADIWHFFVDADALERKLGILRSHCETVGRDIGEIEISVGVGGKGREGRQPDAPEVEGEPLRALGATLFTMGCDGTTGFDLEFVRPWLRWRDELNAAS